MAVANNTILQKMMHELQQAKQKQDQADMLKHIENIRLLCDLFLPENKIETPSIDSMEVSAEELKTMLGEEKTPSSKPQPKFRKSIELDDEDGNGDSLFDF
ncbi:YwdI family protein [Paucisalibacillus globulus]|uniref:YwdI family protein n=1 Tax=Paucisalibacillus globulus TaxID=351095 RepID=UPI000406BA10|nr:YwdI family protein [Paucisalibacillus globulus]